MIDWDKMYDQVLDNSSSPFTRWFNGGYLNACYNCLDRHVANGGGNKVALIHDSPMTNTVRKVTYQELLDSVSINISFPLSVSQCLIIYLDISISWRIEETRCEKGRSCCYLHAFDSRSNHGNVSQSQASS